MCGYYKPVRHTDVKLVDTALECVVQAGLGFADRLKDSGHLGVLFYCLLNPEDKVKVEEPSRDEREEAHRRWHAGAARQSNDVLGMSGFSDAIVQSVSGCKRETPYEECEGDWSPIRDVYTGHENPKWSFLEIGSDARVPRGTARFVECALVARGCVEGVHC